MKVLQINAVYHDGSTGVIVEDLHNIAISNNIESYVAYSTSSIPQGDIPNGYQIGNTFGKKLHAFLCRLNGKQAYFSRFATFKLLKHIEKINPDIVHLHNLHSNYIHLNMLLKYLAKSNTKTVITLHDCWFYTGGCFHYTAAGCDKWLNGCGNCPKKRLDTPAFLLDRSQKILKDRKKYFSQFEDLTIVGVSEWIASEAKKTFFNGNKITTIYNGLDFESFKPTPSDFREKYHLQDKFIILGPASKWLLSANEDIFKAFTSSLAQDEVLVLLGCTQSQVDNLPKNVIGLPFVKNKKELCEIYSAAQVFANCTREESLSLINIETQACGTPIVTFANTGAKETVDNINSFSVETGDINQMLSKIRHIKALNVPAPNTAVQAFVQQKFDKNNNYKSYINLYKSGVLNETDTTLAQEK